jgi:hypothetical protein
MLIAMRRPFAIATLACTLLSPAAPGRAEDGADVSRPDVRPGDRWTYRRVDYDSVRTPRRIEQRVTFANDHVILLVQKNRRGEETDVTMTAEWNLVSSGNGGVYYPHSANLRFPLRPGDSWRASYEVKFPRRGAYDVKHDRAVKVAGWEDVEVPAGRFRALKVMSEGSFERLDRSLAGSVSETVWYVPQVKRYVKWIFESRGFRGRIEWWGLELADYRLQ